MGLTELRVQMELQEPTGQTELMVLQEQMVLMEHQVPTVLAELTVLQGLRVLAGQMGLQV